MPASDPRAALHEHFGFTAFRPGQEEAVHAALGGRDVLVVMPTGAGKSLCYQLPALIRKDLTLVVSPLVSLMEDQVRALARRAPGRVAQVHAQQAAAVNEAAIASAARGDLRVLYVAPERFRARGFVRALAGARVGLFVVDEAHCVSEWGHDFRPDYFRLADAARGLGAEAIVAATATATPATAADIVARLELREPARIATGVDRPNLCWAVVPSAPRARAAQLVAALGLPGATPAIVYAATRRGVERLATRLARALARPVLAYHAGLERAERSAAQQRFMDGDVDVIVATDAFGMGIDKASVRTVVHVTVPGSLEAYYQQAGRAGRDGAPARALLLAAAEDKRLQVTRLRRAEAGDELRRVRWSQHESIWSFVGTRCCRRTALLTHFGDPRKPAATAACCDNCDREVVPEAVRRAAKRREAAPCDLPGTILALVRAEPAIDPTVLTDVLRGVESEEVRRRRYDGLPGFGTLEHVTSEAVLAALDELGQEGVIR